MAFDIQFKLIYQGIRDVFRVRSLSFLYIIFLYFTEFVQKCKGFHAKQRPLLAEKTLQIVDFVSGRDTRII